MGSLDPFPRYSDGSADSMAPHISILCPPLSLPNVAVLHHDCFVESTILGVYVGWCLPFTVPKLHMFMLHLVCDPPIL